MFTKNQAMDLVQATLIYSTHVDFISSPQHIYIWNIWYLILQNCCTQPTFYFLLYPLCCCVVVAT